MKHILKATSKNTHIGFYDASLKPAIKIKSGDTVEVYNISWDTSLISILGKKETIPKAFKEIEGKMDKGPGPHPLTGPIFIKGATPEDTLEVTLLEIEPWWNFGFALSLLGVGALSNDFPYFKGKYITVDQKRKLCNFSKKIKIPLRPIFGSLGVAPPSFMRRVTSWIPGPHGGNLDNKMLVAPSKVYLPIFNDGALFSIGDGHSCQGDGEVTGTALETSMRGLIKLRVIKGERRKWPMAETKDYYVLMGFDANLEEALKLALRNTIDFLFTKGFSKYDAYLYSSLNVDFRITQVVNDVKGVHALVPKMVDQ
jgi:acetamidase/formamidase